MEPTRRLIDYYLPPSAGFVLESLVSTTYQVDFEFLEEELLAAALGVRSPVSRLKAFRSDLERKLQKAEVTVLYDLGGCERLARLSPRIDAIPVVTRKLHSKITLLMWVREARADDVPPDRLVRLIVGSANLTRQGFRDNYECVAAVDFGGRNTSPRALLTKAIAFVRLIVAGSPPLQLARQLAAFEGQAALLGEGIAAPDEAVALVSAEEVVPSIRATWAELSDRPPEIITLVSPFWTEGVSASETLADLIRQLGEPATVELVCRGEKSADGKKWLPVFDGRIAVGLKARLKSRVFLRATKPDADLAPPIASTVETGDELEEIELSTRLSGHRHSIAEVQRALHAKMVLLDGRDGSVLYIGSSNCTRRGLALGGSTNHEAGFVYRLLPRQRKQIAGLLNFTGPASEVLVDTLPATVQPPPVEVVAVPTFLSEVVATGTRISVMFREPVPPDLVLLMPVPTKAGDTGFWLLYNAGAHGEHTGQPVTADLITCPQCDEKLIPVAADPNGQPPLPHVFVEVRWGDSSATYPVRFDDKALLPLLLVGRRPTEGELIDYFLFGKEPDEWDAEDGLLGDGGPKPATDAPIDTRRILAYFVRRFVQAIPGIEAEVRRAAYSHAALDATLRGPTSPLELAERAFHSLTRLPTGDEPQKSPMAVGFQLAEILAALLRCEVTVTDTELRRCFVPVIAQCRAMLDASVAQHIDLQSVAFRNYTARILGDAR